ncbi:MAG: septal ring lytic transglycosylase RlpA family protein [Flavobacterium sp.]
MKKGITFFSAILLIFLVSGFSNGEIKNVRIAKVAETKSDTIEEKKPEAAPAVPAVKETKLTLYKKDVLATYYADKFNGRKTTSGERFHNKKYTAAHMRLPFGTKVRVTNEKNGKWVDVKVNDRGPFSKKLEIDLTKQAFMDIASNKNSGTFKVKIEIIEE